MGANVRLMRGIRLVGLARAYSDMPAASIGRSPRSDAGHPVLDQADFSGQPLDLPTNPASMEAGLRHTSASYTRYRRVSYSFGLDRV